MKTVRLFASACAWLCLWAVLPAAAPPVEPPGGPLPKGAIARLGHARMVASSTRALHVSPDGRWAVCDGECFDLIAGRKKPAPVSVPDGYVLHRLFPGGTHVAKGKDDYALCRPAEKPLRFATDTRGYQEDVEFDARGRLGLYLDSGKGSVHLAELDRKGPVEWRTIARLGPAGKTSHDARLSASGTRAVWFDGVKGVLSAHDLANGKTVVLDARCDGCRALAISPDGKRAAIATNDNDVRTFDAVSGKRLRTVSVSDFFTVTGGWFTPDGKAVVVYDHDKFVLVPVEGDERPRRTSLRERWKSFFDRNLYAPLPDSKRLVTLDPYGVIRVRDLKTGKQLDSHSRFPPFAGVQMLDGHRAASWSRSGKVVVWDVRGGRVLSEADLKGGLNSKGLLGGMEFSRDGRHLVVWGDEDSPRRPCVLAEAATGKVLVRLQGLAAFHPSGKKAVVQPLPSGQGKDSRCRWYDLTRRELGGPVEMPDGDNAFSEDGRTVLGFESTSVSLAEATSGKARWKTALPKLGSKGESEPLLAVLARSGRRAVVVRQRDAFALDAVTGRVVAHVQFRDHPDEEGKRIAAVSASCRWLAVMEEELRLYDLEAEKPAVTVLKDLPMSWPTGLALDADGSRLITSHGDGTCLVWDLKKVLPKAKKQSAEKALPKAKEQSDDPWELLARIDPDEAQPAIVELSRDEAKAVAFLAKKLTPAVEVPAKHLAGWIADLDAEDFDRRAGAERRLAAAGDQAEEQLRGAVLKPASAEQKRLAERLLKRLDPKHDAAHLRHLRALEILERVGTKDAVAVLEKLAGGAPAARLTREARESLGRMKRSERS